MALECGQVIALRRNAPVVVVEIAAATALVVPLGGYNGPPPHRADVRFDDPRDIFACGVSFRFPVAHCHKVFHAAMAVASAAEILGSAPAALLQRINTALRRELSTRVLEARLHHSDSFTRPAAYSR